MSIKSIYYSPQQLRQEFLDLINNFSTDFQTESIAKAIGQELIRKNRAICHQVQTRSNQKFSVIIAGDFKRGKSTLINALLQKVIVTTDVTQETVTINEIEYGSELKINACLRNGGYIKLDLEEIKSEKLLPILEQYPNQISHLKIEAPVEWLQEVRLVDTPGTGDIFRQFDSQIQAYLQNADVIVWVLSAISPLSESEQSFLRLAVLPQDFPKLFFLINMLDLMRNPSEAARLLEATKAKIHRIFPHAHVFGLSALDELYRVQSLQRQNHSLTHTLEKSFQAFRDSLQESIFLNQDIIQLERASLQMLQFLKGLESNLVLLREAMQIDKISLDKAIHQCEDKTSELHNKIKKYKQDAREYISQLCQQSRFWMNEFLERWEKDTIVQLHQFTLDEIRCHLPFFLSEKLREAIQQCLLAHQPFIIENINQAKTSIVEDLYHFADINVSVVDLAVPLTTLDDAIWQNLDAVKMVVHLTPIGEVFRVLTTLFRQEQTKLEKSRVVTNYQQRLKEYLPDLHSFVMQQIDETYTRIATAIEQQIESMYQTEIEASLDALKQAQKMSLLGEDNINTNRELIQLALSIIADTCNAVQTFRHKLQNVNITLD